MNTSIPCKYEVALIILDIRSNYARGSLKKLKFYSHNFNVSCQIQTKLYT